MGIELCKICKKNITTLNCLAEYLREKLKSGYFITILKATRIISVGHGCCRKFCCGIFYHMPFIHVVKQECDQELLA